MLYSLRDAHVTAFVSSYVTTLDQSCKYPEGISTCSTYVTGALLLRDFAEYIATVRTPTTNIMAPCAFCGKPAMCMCVKCQGSGHQFLYVLAFVSW